MFQDEARFGRINSPHSCWVQGKRPTVYCQIVREYTYVYAAVCPFDGTTDSLVLPVADNVAMSIFLAEVSARHPEKNILMFMDKAGWHRANNLKIPHNLRILWLPSYSPELNPAEHLWDELREKWFHNITFDSIQAVEDRLVEGLIVLESNKLRVQSLTGFDWIVSII
jgi:transposase